MSPVSIFCCPTTCANSIRSGCGIVPPDAIAPSIRAIAPPMASCALASAMAAPVMAASVGSDVDEAFWKYRISAVLMAL